MDLVTHGLGKQKDPWWDLLWQAVLGKGSGVGVPRAQVQGHARYCPPSQDSPPTCQPWWSPHECRTPSYSWTVPGRCRSAQNQEDSAAHQPTMPDY